MIYQFSVYNKETGLFTGLVLSTSNPTAEWRSTNIPNGLDIVEGEYNYLKFRVDDGQVIDYIPPAPSSDHEWNPTTKEWELRAEAQRRSDQARVALTIISTLEMQQLRAMRELLLDPNNKAARGKLAEIESQIVTVRQDL